MTTRPLDLVSITSRGCRVAPSLSAEGAPPPAYSIAPGAERVTLAVTTLVCAVAAAWLILQQRMIAATHRIEGGNAPLRHTPEAMRIQGVSQEIV
jgi:hypothetical protein